MYHFCSQKIYGKAENLWLQNIMEIIIFLYLKKNTAVLTAELQLLFP